MTQIIKDKKFPLHPFVCLLLAASSLTACSAADRLKAVGETPSQSAMVSPTDMNGYKPVSMPMPVKKESPRLANSLWNGETKGIFKDQRADEVGDILTVVIDIDDKGEIKNETTRTRTANEQAGLPNLLGFEGDLGRVLPDELDLNNLTSASSDSSHRGSGEVDREEKIEMKLAATVSQVLPNGNMVIHGAQEVRVNFENRVLKLAGIIRPEDIGIDNSISYEKIAEARVQYGGKGQITDVQQPRYGQQVMDVLMPF
jgi:flagellar L-ring protein precursor FlgH